MKADLHMHTTYSDGKKTAKEVLEIASERGLDVVSITDHDTCKGVEENIRLAIKLGIKYIPGIELSTTHLNKPVHVLGYFKDDSYKSEEMLKYYIDIKERRKNRAVQFIENIKMFYGLEVSYEDVELFSNGIIARPHIAKAIIKNYPEYTFDYIFEAFIGDHTKAYVPTCELSVQEGIELLRRNNCIVVLAHPVLLRKHIKEYVLSLNYDGLEARYFQNKDDDEILFRLLAKKRGMIVTGGSDYHGIEKDTKHGDIGEIFLDDEDVLVFLEKIQKD